MLNQTLILETDSAGRLQNDLCPRLLRQRGISAAVLETDRDGGLQLQLRYDPRQITWSQVDGEVRRAGGTVLRNRVAMLLTVSGLSSAADERRAEKLLGAMPDVAASVSRSSRTIRIEFDRHACALPDVAMRLDRVGVRMLHAEVLPQSTHGSNRGTNYRPDYSWTDGAAGSTVVGRLSTAQWLPGGFGAYFNLILASVGAMLLLAGFLVHAAGGPQTLRISLLAACYLIAGWHTARDTIKTLRQFRFDIDVLMFAAAIGAAALGHYEEGGLLLVLFAFGGAGEELALDKARSAIDALSRLAPDTATVIDSAGVTREVEVVQLLIGDEIIVRPFDRLPADGNVSLGSSSVDQSPITGESMPVAKQINDVVFAGTINGEGLLHVKVSKRAGETTLAKIIRLVAEAQTTKSPTQLFTDRVERVYVPIVLVATTLLIFLPPALGGAWGVWFYRAMAFLTAASPCALAIGTPAAVLSGIARAARLGVLVKGGGHLEALGRVNAIAFDKTGTLTLGRPGVTDVIPLGDIDANEMLQFAAAIEAHSSHPLAGAIVSAAAARGVTIAPAQQIDQTAGEGVTGIVAGRRVTVGRFDPAAAAASDGELHSHVARAHAAGETTVVVTIDDRPAGLIALADQLRNNAAASIARLRTLGIERCILLTGDNAAVAEAVRRTIPFDEVHANLLPQDKLDVIGKLRRAGWRVAMIGDGVNDAPALAAADVGIAMGGAGTDVALETADIALMADDLAKLPDAIALSRFSRRIITQNLVIALGVIAVLAPLAAFGYAYLGVAVLFHEGSTVVVVLNSLRLLR